MKKPAKHFSRSPRALKHFWQLAEKVEKATAIGIELKHHLMELSGEECTGDAKPAVYDHCVDLMQEMAEALK